MIEEEKDWTNKIEVTYIDGDYAVIKYPNGRTVSVYNPASWYSPPFSLSKQDFVDYSYGPTFIDLSGGNTATNPSIPTLPMPNPVPIPMPAPAPIPLPVFP